jgi:hypothetical protein
MKKLIVLLTALILSAVSFSQVQLFGTYTEGGSINPDINVFGYGPSFGSDEKFKLTYFILAEKNWAEGIVGVNYSPQKWIEFGLGVGIEQNPALYRVAANVWMGSGKFSFFTWIEKGDGRDNYWYKTVLGYSLSKRFSLEMIGWRFNGSGLSLKTNFNNFSLWVFPAYDLEFDKKRITLGIDIKI